MSTDITIEASPPRTRIEFREFVARDLAPLARSIAVAIGPWAHVDSAIESALRSARNRWSRVGFDNEPELFIFSTAVSLARSVDPPTHNNELNTSACAVAHHGLGWPTQTIAERLGLTRQQVTMCLQAADAHLFIATEADRLRTLELRVQQALDLAEPQLPDAVELDRAHESARRRRRTSRIGALVVALVVILALASQLLSRDERAESAAPVPSAPTATAVDPAGRESAEQVYPPLGPAIADPQLIASDGAGGFVGVRSPSALDDTVEFTQSADGTNWSLLVRATIGSTPTIDRFERSGESYLAWIRHGGPADHEVLATLAVSTDLRRWDVLELVMDEDDPRGLIYEPIVTDVSVNGTNVLAVVRTDIDVDYAALNMSEGYTCGRTMSSEDVSVNMCNGRRFNVLDFASLSSLPNRHRMFVSTTGGPFREVDVPFGNGTTPQVTTVNGTFVLTDDKGVRFATSTDARVWQSGATGRPPFPVHRAATDLNGVTAGLGSDITGALIVFRYESGASSTVSLEAVIGQNPGNLEAQVARGDRFWVVYAYGPTGAGWLLSSTDGARWFAGKVPDAGEALAGEPTLIVGDRHVIVQWRTAAGSYRTQVLSLP